MFPNDPPRGQQTTWERHGCRAAQRRSGVGLKKPVAGTRQEAQHHSYRLSPQAANRRRLRSAQRPGWTRVRRLQSCPRGGRLRPVPTSASAGSPHPGAAHSPLRGFLGFCVLPSIPPTSASQSTKGETEAQEGTLKDQQHAPPARWEGERTSTPVLRVAHLPPRPPGWTVSNAPPPRA